MNVVNSAESVVLDPTKKTYTVATVREVKELRSSADDMAVADDLVAVMECLARILRERAIWTIQLAIIIGGSGTNKIRDLSVKIESNAVMTTLEHDIYQEQRH
jgi:hypothetical protein